MQCSKSRFGCSNIVDIPLEIANMRKWISGMTVLWRSVRLECGRTELSEIEKGPRGTPPSPRKFARADKEWVPPPADAEMCAQMRGAPKWHAENSHAIRILRRDLQYFIWKFVFFIEQRTTPRRVVPLDQSWMEKTNVLHGDRLSLRDREDDKSSVPEGVICIRSKIACLSRLTAFSTRLKISQRVHSTLQKFRVSP
jgi:hypothetical protein